jgi:hypothetical protein
MRRRELIVGISATAWPLTARTRPTADDPGLGLPEPRFAERHSISGGPVYRTGLQGSGPGRASSRLAL